jgi:polysaccharide pyruvyl transferase WcaK-like protein
MAPARIALFGNFGTGNTGNESSLAAMIRSLGRIGPNAEVRCICYAPQIVQRDHGLPSIPIKPAGPRSLAFRILNRLLLRLPVELIRTAGMIAELRRTDVMILPGTGTLDDFGVPAFDWPFHVFKWCVAARLCEVKVGFVSAGAGPIANPLSRFFLRAAARTAAYRSYRDDTSRRFMHGLGVDAGGDPVFPDLVFSLDPPPSRSSPAGARPCIGVGVMAYRGWQPEAEGASPVYAAYLAKIARFVLWLGERGCHVRLLGGDKVDEAAIADLLVVLRRQQGARLDAWLTAAPTSTPAELIDQIARTDRVVATRFHNVLWALMMGKPVISIGYAEKNDVLMADLGLAAYCQRIETLDLDDLKAQFEAQGSERQALTQGLGAKLQAKREALRQQERLIADRLLGDRGSSVATKAAGLKPATP